MFNIPDITTHSRFNVLYWINRDVVHCGGCIGAGNRNKGPNYSDSRITHDETTNYDSSDFENNTDLMQSNVVANHGRTV